MNKAMRWMRWLVGGVMLLAGVALAAGPDPVVAGGEAKDALLPGKPLFEKVQKAAIIRLDGEVNDVMKRSILRHLDEVRKSNCTLVIFEMDTYGGLVTSGLEIATLIKKLPAENIHTVAWVNTKAISAGAMISVACEKIVMSEHSIMGDCGVIAVTSDNRLVPLPPTERAKMESPVVHEFEDSAATNGYNVAVLRAMVVTAEKVYEVLNFKTLELRYVDETGKAKLLATEVPLPDGGVERPWKDQGKAGDIDDETHLLVVGNSLAMKMKLSSATVNNERELKGVLNIDGNVPAMEVGWVAEVTTFLSNIWIRLLLFVGMLIFGWLELAHPGTSIFGILALVFLAILVGVPYYTGIAQLWEIALIIIGLAIIVADLLAFGGVGMIALPGFILMGVGLVASFIPPNPNGGVMPTNGAMWKDLAQGMGVLVGGSFMAIAAFYVLAKYLSVTPGLKRLQLAPAGGVNVDPGALSDVRDAADRPADDAVFVGALGRAISDLRPSGKVRFGDHVVGVESYGSFIESGSEVVVLEVSGMRVVVKPYVIPTEPVA